MSTTTTTTTETNGKNKQQTTNNKESKNTKLSQSNKSTNNHEHGLIWMPDQNLFIVIVLFAAIYALAYAIENCPFTFVQNMRISCHDFVFKHWTNLLNNYSTMAIFVFLTPYGAVLLPYVLTAIPYTIIDYLPKCSLHKYKIQENKNLPPPKAKMIRLLKSNLFNFLVAPLYHLAVYCWMQWWTDGKFMEARVPGLTEMAIHFSLSVLPADFTLFYGHYIVHLPRFYWIHKEHHEWKAPVAFSTLHCHWIENIVVNLNPTYMGMMIFGSHYLTHCLWLILVVINSTIAHSGYHFPFILKSPEEHDFHHLKSDHMYSIGFLDAINGTDVAFKKTWQYKVNKTYFDFTYPKDKEIWKSKCDRSGR